MLLIGLHVVAIGLLILAFARSLRYRQARDASVAWAIYRWTPPYAPRFQAVSIERPCAQDFTAAGVNARRAETEAQRAADNTDFIPDLLAFQCKACLTVYVRWLDAFECHKRNS